MLACLLACMYGCSYVCNHVCIYVYGCIDIFIYVRMDEFLFVLVCLFRIINVFFLIFSCYIVSRIKVYVYYICLALMQKAKDMRRIGYSWRSARVGGEGRLLFNGNVYGPAGSALVGLRARALWGRRKEALGVFFLWVRGEGGGGWWKALTFAFFFICFALL